MPLLIEASRSVLLLIDLQTKLAPAVEGREACIARCRLLLAAARRLEVPVLATEHCPGSVGPTVPELRNDLGPSEIVEKRHFNGAAEEALDRALAAAGRSVVVVAGMEAHVCVQQTIFGLKTAGYQSVLVADAIGSREASSRELAIERMRHHGVDIVNAEMVLFEWLKVGDTKAFKDLLPMIKSGVAG
ncbi:MAG: isochorismatase family protein [Geminicoccaceae bacterium]